MQSAVWFQGGAGGGGGGGGGGGPPLLMFCCIAADQHPCYWDTDIATSKWDV